MAGGFAQELHTFAFRPPLGVASGLVDMAYGEDQTPAIGYAIDHELDHADGVDMLVGQAIEAFGIFTRAEAPVDEFYRAARADRPT